MKIKNLFVSLFFLALSIVSAHAATFTVNSTADNESNGCGTGVCTLREAIAEAQASISDDTIQFDAAVFSQPQTIRLNGNRLIINPYQDLSINGPGAHLLRISGEDASGIIRIPAVSNKTVSISNLTLTNGRQDFGGAVFIEAGTLNLNNVSILSSRATNATSGAIDNYAAKVNISNCLISGNSNTAAFVIVNRSFSPTLRPTMTITDTTIENSSGGTIPIISNKGDGISSNSAGSLYLTRSIVNNNNGIALMNEHGGAVSVTRSKITNNTNSSTLYINGAGVISSGSQATVTVSESYIDNNRNLSSSFGAGINNYEGTLTVASSTVSRNKTKTTGGGIFASSGSIALTNTTIFQNETTTIRPDYSDFFGGAGLYFSGTATATILNCTVAQNFSSQDTGGVKKVGSSTVTIRNSIVTGNIARAVNYGGTQNPLTIPDAYGEFTSHNGNVIGDTTLNGGWATYDRTGVSISQAGVSGALFDNGGFVPTLSLSANGQAVGAGKLPQFDGYSSPATDARGLPRADDSGNSRNDAGAFQFYEYLPTPTVPDLTAATDSGVSQTDNLTNSRAPVFKVTGALPNAKVFVVKNGINVTDGLVDANGEFSFTDAAAPANAAVNYQVFQDAGGIKSRNTAPLTVVYDTLAPTVSFSAASNPATAQPVNLTAAFSETVYGFGQSDLSLAGSTADLSAANLSFSGSAANYALTISNIRTIGRILPAIAANAGTDAAGNGNAANAPFELKYIGDGTVSVTKTADGASCLATDCSLRGAVALINDLNLPATNFTIRFNNIPANDPNCASAVCMIRGSELVLRSNLTITGTGAANQIAVSGDRQSRVFYVAAGANVTLRNLIVSDGNATSQTFPAENGNGGGIVNRGTLQFEDVWVLDNVAALSGGAIANYGNLTIYHSTISRNTANASQSEATGGIGSFGFGNLMLVNSTLSGNRAPNAAAGSAGALWTNSLAIIINSTISANEARTYGGIHSVASFGSVRIRNSIIAGNRGLNGEVVPDIGSDGHFSRFVSLGNNLIGNRGSFTYFSQAGDQTGTPSAPLDAGLAPLYFYGGRLPTHALLNNSPARDAGNSCVLTNACAAPNIGFNLTNDQRGSFAPRRIGAAVDIGAFEASIAFSTSATGAGGQGTLPTAILNGGYAVTFAAARLSGFAEPADGQKQSAQAAPFFYFIAAGSLPSGLSLDTNSGVLSGTPTQSGNFSFAVSAYDADGIAGAQSYNLLVTSVTAANISVGGRVTDIFGQAIARARVTLTDSAGNARSVVTNSFGFYRFDEVAPGQTYVVTASRRQFSFAPQVINTTEDLTELNFLGAPE